MNTPDTNIGSAKAGFRVGAKALAALAIAAIVVFAVGGVVVPWVRDLLVAKSELRAKYILVFGDGVSQRVKIKSQSDFETAIDPSNIQWRQNVSISDPQGGPVKHYPDVGSADPNVVTVSRAAITQLIGIPPCSMHVTQKVALKNEQQVETILSLLDTN